MLPEVPRGELSRLSISALLMLSRGILRELRDRGVLRTGNAPAGDYAELLVRAATDGLLATNSQAGWDIQTPDGVLLQVKARVVTNPRNRGERQLSVFRSWGFDAAIVVLFDDDFKVWRASKIEQTVVEGAARYQSHVQGHVVLATDTLMALGEDWTDRLRAVAI